MDLKTLCLLPGISGREELIRKAVYEECVRVLGKKQVYIDKLGNIIAHQQGKAANSPSVMLAAHMDEVGLMSVSTTEDGLLRVRAIGELDSRMLVSKRVEVGYPSSEGEKPLKGVIGAMAIHLQTARDRKNVLPIEKVYVDIGAKDKKEAEKKAPIGTPITFDSPYLEYGEERISSKALPGRAGVEQLLKLMALPHQKTVDYVFTSLAEVGGRGALGASYALQPAECLILDGMIANDGAEEAETARNCCLGEGVCLSLIDRRVPASSALFIRLAEMAASNGILYQLPSAPSVNPEANGIQSSCEGVQTLVLGLPARNLYSPMCVCSRKDIQAQYDLLNAYLC